MLTPLSLFVQQSDSAKATSTSGDTINVKLHADYFQTHRLDKGPELDLELPKSQLVDMYQQMVTMRRMEMAADQVSASTTLSVRSQTLVLTSLSLLYPALQGCERISSLTKTVGLARIY